MIKAILLDFDGTLVNADMSEVVADIAGKKEEVRQNNLNFHNGVTKGLTGLIASINLLKGVSLQQIDEKLNEQDYLMPGAHELLAYLHENGIISILASGSILPVLQHYQKILRIDYIIGSRPQIKDNIIQGISEDDYPHADFKLYETKKMLEALNIDASETIAIGDSPGDKSRFEFSGKSIAINPKGEVEKYADYVIKDSLLEAISIIEKIRSNKVA
ncbi:MAG TPA: HAD family phosphatase [Candidatus Saccharimonadales bacterium]|nr:HAD family phosphatase [Candidatus Saccharimonadales bacterium]